MMGQLSTDDAYFWGGLEEFFILLLLVGLVIFLLLQIYRCAKVVLDPYANLDQEAWAENLGKGTLQSLV
ncbi:unnamed protein product [Clavelina lepadiformis]|uniref:ATP synthase F0 subunit 8 n=1 Tax=Clavelina lepadiformis TaxID=159417 RepID=A0ABP0EV99_CLALP